jgi:peptide/nickel transport system substrate-binding protein
MNCILLNCDKAPFNDPSLRRAAAMSINRTQYAKEIDHGILPVSTGAFVPGSPYYSNTHYPAFNPSEAAKLVKAAAKKGGDAAISFKFGATTGPASVRAQEYLQQAMQQVGFKVTNTTVLQNDLINNALAGTFQALSWRQFGAVDPDLNYIFWSTTTASTGSLSINMARNSDPKIEAALQIGRSATDPKARAAAYKAVNQRFAIDLPYLWSDRAVWAVVGGSKAQNWNNPTTPDNKPAFGMIGGQIWPTQIWVD